MITSYVNKYLCKGQSIYSFFFFFLSNYSISILIQLNVLFSNIRYIHSKNRENIGFKLAVNHLADYSKAELKTMCGYRKMQPEKFNGGLPFPYGKNDFKNLPSEIDWRIEGAVTPVKGK